MADSVVFRADTYHEESAMSTVTTATRHTLTETPIGPVIIVRNDDGLTGLYFPGHWTRPDRSAFGPRASRADRGFDDAITQLAEYFEGRRREFELPLTPHGTAEALAAWGLIARIPYGSTTTYGALARQLGGQITPRDFGWYVAHNPLSILIPCHRVVGADGSLTGYAGGLKRKRHLLELEGAIQPADQPLW
jgi:methylated-DNA-[protein]-cysteine S-methyltransferase